MFWNLKHVCNFCIILIAYKQYSILPCNNHIYFRLDSLESCYTKLVEAKKKKTRIRFKLTTIPSYVMDPRTINYDFMAIMIVYS